MTTRSLPYYEGFADLEDMCAQFGLFEADMVGVDVKIAIYDCGDYEGSALVIFRRDGKLYEVHDSHCSCNGLDNWDPEETSVAALRLRGSFSRGVELEPLDALELEDVRAP